MFPPCSMPSFPTIYSLSWRLCPYPLPAGSGLLQDLGFLSFTLPEVAILMPTKKPRGEELTLEQQLANQALHQRRLRIEHVNSSVKRCGCGSFGTTPQPLVFRSPS